MDYSIVMPVFNREDLTKNCLATLLPTLEGAGDGELIIVDNGSGPATAEVLRQFPWVRVIRNETNLGFAAACNQGARAAAGRLICHLNNDIVAQPHWLARMIARLAPDVGIVGARLLFPDDTIQHAGVAMYPVRFGPEGVGPYHLYWHWKKTTSDSLLAADFNIVTGACLLTPRDLFLELGGFDEMFWNGYEDVDYCLRVRERGLRVVYEPDATLYHFESQSGVQRKRRVSHNIWTLGTRWGTRFDPDHNRYWARDGHLRREAFAGGGRSMIAVPLPPTTLIVHGEAPSDPIAFMNALLDNRLLPERKIWLARGAAPAGFEKPSAADDAVESLRPILEDRSDRYFALVDTSTGLRSGWLDDLMNAIEYSSEVVAATVTPEPARQEVEPCAADGRCTLLNLRDLPAHIRFGQVDTVDGAIVEITWRAVELGLGVRGVRERGIALGAARQDAAFAERFGSAHEELRRADAARLESACTDRALPQTFASIVMLSWNAPEYTKMAVESIHAYSRSPYEIIIVDNGSKPETLAMLAELPSVRVIYNATNKGFAYGCNQGIAAAQGTHVVLLNNDVIVTEGWLEHLLDANRRDPLVGVSAPRSNRIVGHQQISDVPYDSTEAMHVFAQARTREFAGIHYWTDRAIGFCLCISR
ncbi:MAG: glycosyltransferase family 2 protein, partial [Candidatus Velthaea sp.]